MTDLTADIGAAVGSEVVKLTPVPGGDICQSFRAELRDGREVFVKSHDNAGDMFELEAAGLRWLSEAKAVPIPEVLATTAGLLVLQYVPGGSPRGSEAELGRGLAALHAFGAPAWGWDRPANLATIPLPNDATDTWAEFYGQRRIMVLIEAGIRRSVFDESIRAEGERLCARLPELLGPQEPPARLHGDLWGGNIHWDTAGQGWLVDPSCYGGHREVDLAMLRLFGSPGPAFWEAYEASWPLSPGWQARVRLYQLLPLLVHALLFGGGYVRSAHEILREYA